MSNRTVLNRARRTKMYDCNYTMGERYYKPVVDSLDRKYSTRVADPVPAAALSSLRPASLDRDVRASPRRALLRQEDDIDDAIARRKATSSLLNEFDSIYEGRRSNMNMRMERSSGRAYEDDADTESASMKRLRASRARAAAIEEDFESSIAATTRSNKRREIENFSEKVLDSVGIKNDGRAALEDNSFFKKRTLKITSEDDEEAPSMTKWTSLKGRRQADADDDFEHGAAAMRARKSRARLADLEAEMEQVAGRTAAREQRNRDLRAMVLENEANSESSASNSAIRVKKTTIRSEKKTVTF